ncbi:hypothetical protein ASPSYDRAFT_373538 [Aspergillus sydowii CBS 593.65]|uniref:Kinase OspG kinase domain-containing protein n=1 Tax=Aspergillus sydowii CBS 593.65 TaxID=1036612 RepID=A0A1L9U0K2_9EURO|nr:uncharacterized protein ASPSYDRAFT_373538 [Aspergillus sydowii CBS 593.65]OJJ65185.1 hypothetical protein ASPSYDRAFT_373538 [Aspergillus sydowii CBS 593.65]
MERVPGVPLTEFRTYDFAKQQRIREAFRKSLMKLDCHITLFDTHPGNVLYDENEDKCYFIDFEETCLDVNEDSPPNWLEDDEHYEREYRLWGLDG